jgi:hypothetical protein
LQRTANQDQKRNLTRVYMLVEQQQIIGYYSIGARSVPTDQLPDNAKLGSYQEVPFLLLGCLAVVIEIKVMIDALISPYLMRLENQSLCLFICTPNKE